MGSLNIRQYPLVRVPGLTSSGWHCPLSVPLASKMDWCLSAFGAGQREASKNGLCFFPLTWKHVPSNICSPWETINVNGLVKSLCSPRSEIFLFSPLKSQIWIYKILFRTIIVFWVNSFHLKTVLYYTHFKKCSKYVFLRLIMTAP